MAMSKDELDYIKNLFNKMDKDQNGRVGLTEFLNGKKSSKLPVLSLFGIHLRFKLAVDKATPGLRLGR